MCKISLVLMALAAGCGSSVSADKACTDLAAAVCTELSNCAAPLITMGYGDVATCQARAKLGCLPSLMAPSSSATTDKLDRCATALDAAMCSTLFVRDTPMACIPDPGKLANGTACGDDAQCVSTYCKKPANSVCGVCGDRAAAGGACGVNEDCQYKLQCANAVCVSYNAVGESCDANHPCAQPNTCKNGVCAVPAGAGQACTPAANLFGDCDETKGLWCPPMTRVCALIAFAAPGQPCGAINGGLVGCSAGGRCKLSGVMGTCMAPAADGAACDTTNGPDCLAPAACVSGTCKLPNPAGCM